MVILAIQCPQEIQHNWSTPKHTNEMYSLLVVIKSYGESRGEYRINRFVAGEDVDFEFLSLSCFLIYQNQIMSNHILSPNYSHSSKAEYLGSPPCPMSSFVLIDNEEESSLFNVRRLGFTSFSWGGGGGT